MTCRCYKRDVASKEVEEVAYRAETGLSLAADRHAATRRPTSQSGSTNVASWMQKVWAASILHLMP